MWGRPLNIHAHLQRTACPDAEAEGVEASEKGIHPGNKKCQPLPLLECHGISWVF